MNRFGLGTTRARVVAIAVLALCALGGLAGASASAQTGKKAANLGTVRYAYLPSVLPEMGIDAALRLGFFKKYGLDVQFVTVGSAAAGYALVQAGKADMVTASVDLVAKLKAQGFDNVIVNGFAQGILGSLVCRKGLNLTQKYPNVMKRLEGAKFATNAFPSTNWTVLAYTMQAAGADPTKMSRVVSGSIGNSAAAVSSGNADCALLSEPILGNLIATGKVDTIVDYTKGEGPTPLQKLILGVSGAATSWANDHPKQVVAFAKAVRDACIYSADPANVNKVAAAIAPDFPGTSLDDRIGFVKLNARAMKTGWKISPANISAGITAYNAAYPTDKVNYPYSQLIAKSIIDSAPPTTTLGHRTRKGRTVTVQFLAYDKPASAMDLTDFRTGVKSYTVQVRVGSGAWKNIAAATTQTKAVFKLGPKAATVRVRAVDKNGNIGAWVQASLPTKSHTSK